jgi:small subunit ribosomal protein S20
MKGAKRSDNVPTEAPERVLACAEPGKPLLCPVFLGCSTELLAHEGARTPSNPSNSNIRNQGFTNMANTAQARKRARQAEVRRQHNASLKSTLRTALKKVKKAIAGGDKAAATKEFKAQQSVIDRIADKKIVHKNTASRNKTRLAQAIKALP